ncbi:MAG: DUF2189 domain-containing protein [Hyphomicrobiaceae bacterium]|nr:DUF2189 domain-containing protein [Hyphomicrobiaceae bacterium]
MADARGGGNRGLAAAWDPDGVAVPHRVPFDAPWMWLAAGWRDLWAAPAVGLTYGLAFAGGAAALALGLWSRGAQALFPAFAGGFFLIAPFLAMGLYDASRRLAGGEPVSLASAAGAGLAAKGQIAFFGVVLMIVFLVWLELAFMLLMLFMGGQGLPPASEFLPTLLFTGPGLGLLIVGSIVGGCLATLVFAMSAVAVPMLLVERVDAVTAIRSSIAAVAANPKPMALWAALIAVMIAAGFVTLLAGLVLAFPLIGHATWHAYCHIRNGVAPPIA